MGIDNAIYIFFILWTPVMIFVYIVDFFFLSVKPWTRYGYICVLKGHICLSFFLPPSIALWFKPITDPDFVSR